MKNKTSRAKSMKLKKAIAASLAISILFSFTGCGTSSGSATTESSKQEDTSATASSTSVDPNEKLNDLYQQENQIFADHKNVWDKVFGFKSKNIDDGSMDKNYANFLANTIEANKDSFSEEEHATLSKDIETIRGIEEEIMKRIGDTEKNEVYGNFSIADSLAKNINEIYNLYYNPDESAYKKMQQLKTALDGPFKTTTEKGDALEKLILFLFQQIKNVTATNKVKTYTNQFDCTVCFDEYSDSFPYVMKHMSPYFIIECKNETTSEGKGKTPSNTYFHKLAGIMDSNNAKIGIIVSRGEPSKEDMIIAHDNFLLHKNTNCPKFLLSFSENDLEKVIDKRQNLLQYMNYKMNVLTMNAKNPTYDMLEQENK